MPFRNRLSARRQRSSRRSCPGPQRGRQSGRSTDRSTASAPSSRRRSSAAGRPLEALVDARGRQCGHRSSPPRRRPTGRPRTASTVEHRGAARQEVPHWSETASRTRWISATGSGRRWRRTDWRSALRRRTESDMDRSLARRQTDLTDSRMDVNAGACRGGPTRTRRVAAQGTTRHEDGDGNALGFRDRQRVGQIVDVPVVERHDDPRPARRNGHSARVDGSPCRAISSSCAAKFAGVTQSSKGSSTPSATR